MRLILAEEKVRQTIRKNTAASYGLSLVIGLPFPAEIRNRVGHIQGQLETLAPGRFTWYGVEHLHATLVAPLRGRYREGSPLGREELPADLQGFTDDLVNLFAQRQPFALELAGVHITPEGFVMVGENILVGQLASTLLRYPELDQPKHLKGLPVAIGFFNAVRPFASDEEQACFETALARFRDTPVGQVTVGQVWLVHYANRTLSRIVGKVAFTLGRTNDLAAERLLRELDIAEGKLPVEYNIESQD
jgi:hypothetical protein